MLAAQELIAFLATNDAVRARDFYHGVLELPLIADEPFALVFDARGTKVRIQKTQGHVPAPHTALGWAVKAIDEVIDGLAKRGVRFERFEGMIQDERAIWCAPSGARIAWFKDPDGNVLSLTEF